MRLMGIDPGEHVGFVEGVLREGTFTVVNVSTPHWTDEQLYAWMKDEIRDALPEEVTMVCEDYIIDPRPKSRGGTGYDHQWDKGVTLRQIGALRLLCETLGWKFVLQPNYRKPAGYGFLGKKYVRGAKERHTLDALAHLTFYGVSHKMWSPTVREMEPEPSVPTAGSHPKFRRQSVPLWRKPHKP